MRFFCVSIPQTKPSEVLLQEACERRGIEFVKVEVEHFNFANQPKLPAGDLVYRPAATPRARIVEQLLVTPNTATFYQDVVRVHSYVDNVVSAGILHQLHGIPAPATIFALPTNHQDLDQAVEKIGGYPVIIKAGGGSHGVGIIKIDSASSLYSVTDYLRTLPGKFVMKEFIKVSSSARLVVLGDKVIDSIEYQAPEGDFRSNEGHVPNVVAKKFSPELEALAVKATQVLGLEFGGVDILIDDQNQPYVTEVNFPCFFPRCQNLTGTDISGMMIQYLIDKSQRLVAN